MKSNEMRDKNQDFHKEILDVRAFFTMTSFCTVFQGLGGSAATHFPYKQY